MPIIMKQMLLFATCTLCLLVVFPCASQTVYKLDQLLSYDNDSNVPAVWEQQTTLQFTYANGGNKETKILALSFPEGDNLYQVIKTYNAGNYVQLEVVQYWNESLSQWYDASQTIYTYDGSNNLIEEKAQTYNPITMGYLNNYRVLNGYSGNNLTTETRQTWNIGTNTWLNIEKNDYTYSGNLPTLKISSTWDTPSMSWIPNERDTPTYSGNLVTNVKVDKYNGGVWEDYERIAFTYNGQGLETEYLSEIWNGAAWVNEYKDTSIYDANGNRLEFIEAVWNGTEWVGEQRVVASYSIASPLATRSFEVESFKVYPNPASNFITVSSNIPINNFEMYDVLSKKVLSSSEGKQINIEHLKSGVYILKAFGNNQSATQRVIKK